MSTEPQRIGVVKGPGELPHEYTCITLDSQRSLRHGEFVYYLLTVEGRSQPVLGRVTERLLVCPYPDAFLADTRLSPDEMAGIVGVRLHESELFQITVAILGYFDETLGAFINPRIPPRLGEPIYLAEDELLRRVLCKHQPGEDGAAEVGWLLSRSKGAVPIVLAVEEFVSTHLAIIAGTGSGKSYLAGVIIEELMKANNRAAVLIVDPHGEYKTLNELANGGEFADKHEAYQARAHMVLPDHVKIQVNGLRLGDLRHLMPNMTEKQDYFLQQAFRTVTTGKNKGYWTLEHLKEAIRAVGKKKDEEGDSAANTVGALEWRLESMVGQSRIFNEHRDIELGDYFRPGQCTVLPLNDIEEREQQVMVTVLLRKLFEARQATERGEVESGDVRYLPYPVFVLLEEAHNYAPAGQDVVSTRELKRILAEGRKFGVGVGLITQRPGKVHADVLSQCMTQCIMRIVNPIDQAAVAEAVESVGRDLLNELPALSKGQVIIAGSAVRTPVLCQVRRRHTPHGGETPNAPSAWRDAWRRQKQGTGQQQAFYASGGLRQLGKSAWEADDEG